MKNYNVEAVISFNDIEEKIQRVPGDNFKCTKQRYEYLLAHNAIKLIGIDEEKKKEIKIVEKETKPIKVTKRKVK